MTKKRGRRRSTPGMLYHPAARQFFVKLNGEFHYLGNDKPAAKARYDRIVAEWLANDRHLPHDQTQQQLSVNALCLAFLRWAGTYYLDAAGKPTSEIAEYRASIKLLTDHCGRSAAASLSITAVKTIRENILLNKDWNYKTINKRIDRIKRIIKWGCAEKLIPAAIYQEVSLLEGLRAGRCAARVPEPVEPVDPAIVAKTIEYCHSTLADMVRVQLLCGMRPQDVTNLRPDEIDRASAVWIFRPSDHKTRHRGRAREIFIGPQCQAILTPYLMETGEHEYVFSPRRAVAAVNAEKRAKRRTKVQPSQVERAKRRAATPRATHREKYDTNSYRTAVQRAQKRAGVPKWFPNQLRHTRGTQVRDYYGLEAAQVFLGHASADVTQIYAERDREKAIRIALETG